MSKINCWEFRKCGREIGGANVDKYGVCPASVDSDADGFCGGKNGGRACRYILNTLCENSCQTTYEKKDIACEDCEFRRILKKEHPIETTIFAYYDYVTRRKRKKTEDGN